MKKTFLKQMACLSLALVMAVSASATYWWGGMWPSWKPEVKPETPVIDIDWEHRYTWDELTGQLNEMAETYPGITELYAVGASQQERELWCLEITDEKVKTEKTGIAVIANIHGGERESASSAMYTAWWFVTNSDDAYVKNLLKNYIIYVIPVMNPDGYEQSFVTNTRQNLRPRDLNGNGAPFSDPYADLNGDGYIGTLYKGNSTDPVPTSTRGLPSFGTESPDWDNNGKIGDDPRNSGIDMNRTFNYQWNRYDIETYKTGNYDDQIGVNAWSSTGAALGYEPASEPEVQAIQHFLYDKMPAAFCSLHTGIQCVLYPWCYRAYDETNPKDADIPFMKETATAMAQAYQDHTGRGFYVLDSFHDYTTSSEMIDYGYGRLGIHAYTIEVYQAGGAGTADVEECSWGNVLPAATWDFMTKDELKAAGMSAKAIANIGDDYDGVWVYTNGTAQMVDKAPTDQTTMVEGCLEAVLVMIESEPYGNGPVNPGYYK